MGRANSGTKAQVSWPVSPSKARRPGLGPATEPPKRINDANGIRPGSAVERLPQRRGARGDLDPAIVEAIRTKQDPKIEDADTACVYRFAKALNEGHNVDDATYNEAVERFGHGGVVELVALCGYYTLIGMTLNVFGIDPPEGEAPFND